MRKLLILNYCDIVGTTSTDSARHLVSIQTLEAQLNIIQSSNIPIIRLKDWRRGNVSNGLNVALTFDGGHASHFTLVKPLLEKLNIQACFLPEIQKLETPTHMSWHEIKALTQQQHSIGIKDNNQPTLNKMNPNELILHLENLRRTMRSKMDQAVIEYAMPSGKISNKTLEFIEISGFSNILTNKAKINVDTEQFVLHRHRISGKMGFTDFSKLIQEQGWVLFKTGLFAEVESWFTAVNSIPDLDGNTEEVKPVEAAC